MQHERSLALPNVDAVSARHSECVAAHIRQRATSAGGQLSFAAFMHEALYAPGLGYYAAGNAKFGEAGDFVTAPEVSSVFGAVLACQCCEVLQAFERPEILEVGAGSGKLACDLMQAFVRDAQPPSRYCILEVSPDLQQRQAERLRAECPREFEKFEWLTELPEDFHGVVVANELLDALPVERFVRRQDGVMQQRVAVSDSGFDWSEAEAPPPLARAVLEIEDELGVPLPDGYSSEVSLAGPSWIADVAACLRHGAVFLFDYGVSRREYYAPDRNGGWLRCHFRHHAHNDPLVLVGVQDITTWVDFTAVAHTAVNVGMDVLGYQTQSQFLLGGGLEREMRRYTAEPLERQLELSAQVKTLTLPGAMGEHFKCMVLGRGDVATPSAFGFANRAQTL